MHYFNYKNDKLYAEEVSVEELAETYGTPLYIYSHRTLVRHFNAYKDAFAKFPHIICFALKANPNLSILNIFRQLGGGADIVSGGELFRADKAHIPHEKIVYAGVGKTPKEIEYALKKDILMFNVESDQELEMINKIAQKLNLKARIALRVNPDVDPMTHPYISTGLKENKFGIPIESALEHYQFAATLKNIEIVGIHKHIGSQITDLSPYVNALERLLLLIEKLKENGINLKYLDIGGGLGIQYNEETPPTPAELINKILPMCKNLDITLIVEPGRSLVGNAGILVSRVLYTKKGAQEFFIVDAGMNDLMRPSLYKAYHSILPVAIKKRPLVIADIVGPICESGDFLCKKRKMPALFQGELIAVMSAGAYGASMSSNYNSRPMAAEIMVDGNKHYIVKERQTWDSLILGENVLTL
ncbi:MAG: diaminopimelate decarboxylase [Nitrospirae bacterium]|nr:diaminopimelate decarboxylase [Nitrospirota bacterium]